MSGKNQSPIILNWQSTSPVTGFLPLNNNTAGKGSVPSSVLLGAMASTNVIYSQIIDLSRMDNLGLQFNWTGTPTGTIVILASNDGAIFYPDPDSPSITQPSGSATGTLVNLNQFPYKYLLVQYTNTSGSGNLTSTAQQKDLN